MALINYLTSVQFDFGALTLLPAELKKLGIARPFLVTDKGVRAAGLLDRVTGVLGEGLAPTVYDDTPANPTEDAALQAAEAFKAAGCDGIVALGGGSAIDLAKAVALIATHPGPLQQYAAVEGGVSRIGPVAPLIAIPTTAGTGSEVGRAAVIIIQSGRKLGLLSPHLLPKLAICDPELTIGLPPMLTAATGMDAISHCVETFLAPAVNPPAEAIALDGLSRAIAHIERATRDGSDRDARWNMMMAAMEGAMAFQKGLGAVHALSHPLGALPQRPHHGTLNAILLPAVLRFNRPSVGAKWARLNAVLGLPEDGDAAGFFAGLNSRLGLPAGFTAMGISREDLAPIPAQALKDHCHATNPRLASEDDYRGMLEESL